MNFYDRLKISYNKYNMIYSSKLLWQTPTIYTEELHTYIISTSTRTIATNLSFKLHFNVSNMYPVPLTVAKLIYVFLEYYSHGSHNTAPLRLHSAPIKQQPPTTKTSRLYLDDAKKERKNSSRYKHDTILRQPSRHPGCPRNRCSNLCSIRYRLLPPQGVPFQQYY